MNQDAPRDRPSSLTFADDLRQDLRSARRLLLRNPGFTLTIVLTLALGVGATTAIFSVVNAVLLQPLPYPDSDRLVRIVTHRPAGEGRGVPTRTDDLDEEQFVEWRARTTTLAGIGMHAPMTPLTMTIDGRHERLSGASVMPSIFGMLGVRPLLGRVFDDGDERTDAKVAILGAVTWQRYFGEDRQVIGRTILLNGTAHTVVGVMPAGFEFPMAQAGFWVPYTLSPAGQRRNRFRGVLARLRDGVSIDTASAEAHTIGQSLEALGRASSPRPGPSVAATSSRFEVVSMKDEIIAPARPAVRVLIVAVGVVLLIVCANVANLLLARGTTRQREMGMRLALGASRGRILRQVLTESLVLSLAGGAAGTAIAFVGVRLLTLLASVDVPELFRFSRRIGSGAILPRLDQVAIDPGVLAFTAGVSIVTGVLFGLAPALHASRVPLGQAGGSIASAASGRSTARRSRVVSVLVVGQLVMATMLLVGAGLLIHSFIKLSSVKPGYDPTNVLTFQLVLPSAYAAPQTLALAEQLATRLRSRPRITAAGYTNAPPLLGITLQIGTFVPPGSTEEAMRQDPLRPQGRAASQDYLRAMGVRLLEGRWFDARDDAGQAPVLLVNKALAERYFGRRSPVGSSARFQGSQPWQIIGVVDDMRQAGLDEDPYPTLFVEPRQTIAFGEQVALGFLSYAVRVDREPAAVASDVRALVRQLDPAATLDSVATLEQLVAGSVARPRFYAVVLGLFGAIAGVLAAIGIYGVQAHAVAQRTQEIGIRMALGARPGTVLRSVLARGGVLTIAGITLGVVGAVGVTRYLTGMLYGVTPLDAWTYVLVSLAFAAVATLASYVPARRATKIDPLAALRQA